MHMTFQDKIYRVSCHGMHGADGPGAARGWVARVRLVNAPARKFEDGIELKIKNLKKSEFPLPVVLADESSSAAAVVVGSALVVAPDDGVDAGDLVLLAPETMVQGLSILPNLFTKTGK